MGYEKVGETIQSGKDSLYGGVFNYFNNNKIITGVNDASDAFANLRYFDTGGYWTNIITNAPVNTRFNCLNYLNEFYVAGASPTTYLTLQNIDSTLVTSTTRNVQFAPKAKFVSEFNGTILAMNVEINGVKYKDRVYQSSNTLSVTFITQVQTDQKGLLQQLRVNSVRYIKPGMVVDIWGASSEAQKVSSLTVISVDKKNNRFSFAPTLIDVADNDELWLPGRKNQTNTYWNTDYPNPQDADYFQVGSSRERDPEIVGHIKNNNRQYIFTRNAFIEYDGANVRTISDTIGCVSHESIQNIGSWTIWLHDTGVWGYNSNTGQLKFLSRAMDEYIRRIKQVNLEKASAGVVGRIYKLSIGELLDITTDTTSTSTSSTSTSSTSSSTSSTSTSSTSTSSTSSSTSTTVTTTSTSSTSISTSSTSISTTSVSTSSTSSSTSMSTSSTTTTTVASTKKVVRLCYDFDANSWWPEEHKREIRFQFNHTMSGYTKPYFTDDTGRLFRDETGNLDNFDSIPMEVEFGRNNLGTDQRKVYLTALVDSEAARGAIVMYSLDGLDWQSLGQITKPVTPLPFPQSSGQIEGRDINYKVTHNETGSQPVLNGITTYFSVVEGTPNEQGRV